MLTNKLLGASFFALCFAQSAAAAVFTSEATFLSSVTPTSVETFESATLSGTASDGGITFMDFGPFSVTTAHPALKIINFPFFGAENTTPGGSQFLYIDTDIGFFGTTVTVTFDAPVEAVGFSYTALGGNGSSPTISVDGGTFGLSAVSSPSYFGVTSGSGITSFTIDMDQESAFGIDDFTIASSAAVPLPASLPLMAGVLAGLGLLRRRTS